MSADHVRLTWELARADPGSIADASPGVLAELDWCPMAVPGTAAGAWRADGRWSEDGPAVDFDDHDWWFRGRTGDVRGPALLHLGGLATIADVWWNGDHVLASENMYLEHRVEVVGSGDDELVVVCRSLRAHLRGRGPRLRWKTRIVADQQLRRVRTTMLGRMPSWTPPAAPVGPWRDVWLEPFGDAGRPPAVEVDLTVRTHPSGAATAVLAAELSTAGAVTAGRLAVGDLAVDVSLDDLGDGRVAVRGELDVGQLERWWPSTHGTPRLHDASLVLTTAGGTRRVELPKVGIRSIEVDRTDGSFRVQVNGVEVFCRGACWVRPDVVNLHSDPCAVRQSLAQMVAAGMNMVRVTGTSVYEDEVFLAACDELGLLVWHDFMFANMDYPVADEAFRASVDAEVSSVLRRLRGHPCVAVLCGGSEVEQQAAMMGLDPTSTEHPLGRTILAEAVAAGSDAAYVPDSPSGGDFPFTIDSGISHYYGVGAYLRPLDDARRAGVRFTSECLAFANVPCRESVDELLGDGERPGHHPAWKARVPRDRGAGWDFEDVRDHYVRSCFGVDPGMVRYADPDRYLDLGRAAVAVAVESSFHEWRRPGSTCAGALVLMWRDMWAGPGWGLVDVAGRPKSAYHALARSCAPVAVLVTDEGLNGLRAHVVNDRAEALSGQLRLRAFGRDGSVLATAERDVAVEARGAVTVGVDAAFGGFRDLNFSYRFGPSIYDLVLIELLAPDGSVLARAHHLPGGHVRPVEHDLGLRVAARPDAGGVELTITTERFAQFVSIDVAGGIPADDWFHLEPGGCRSVAVRGHVRADTVEVRALNASGLASIDASSDASIECAGVGA